MEYAKKGARVTGIDSKKLEVDQASFVFESYGFQGVFHQDDVMNAWKYGQFDIVNACGLLYHLPYPMLFLDLISLICRKHLILSTRISPEMNGSMELMRQETHGNWWFPTEECVGRMTMLAGFTDLVILSVNGDRSNLFCSARGRTNLRELSETENAFEYLIESRSPSGRRIIGASARNDFPES